MLTLYHAAYSTCSQKVRLCLAEKKLEWKSHEVDLAGGEQTTPAYLEMNPNGVVPTLVHDGQAVIESSVICEFLDEVYPKPPLAPADPVERAAMRAWLRFIDEIPTPAIRVPSLSGAIKRRMAALSEDEFRKAVEAKPLRKYTFQQLGQSGFSAAAVAEARDKLLLTISRMAQALERSAWLAGEMYSLADTCMTPMIQRLEDLGLEHYWSAEPAVGDWLARVQARPSFEQAYYPGSHFTQDGVSQTRPALTRQ